MRNHCVAGIALLLMAVSMPLLALTAEPVEFQTDIMPLLSKHGCNAAECHGSATGQADFKLSLFGGNWQADYRAIVEQLEGRRVNLREPERSLFFRKPTELLEHAGGERFPTDSEAATKIASWIAAGATDHSTRTIAGIQVESEQLVRDNEAPFILNVDALTSAGIKRINQEATFESSNSTHMEVSTAGVCRALKPGKYFVLIRYLGFTKCVTIVRRFPDAQVTDAQVTDAQVTDAQVTDAQSVTVRETDVASSLVSRHVQQSAEELGLLLPPAAEDHVVVRRLYLDLVGRQPRQAEVSELSGAIRDRTSGKFEAVVDRLLASSEFAIHWTYWLRSVLGFKNIGNDDQAAQDLNHWMHATIQNDEPVSKAVHALLTGMGDTTENPAANFHRFYQDGREEGEAVASAFLGVQIGCANCHNHPLDRWTQEDYHGLAAIFATLKRGTIVSDFPEGSVVQPKTGRPANPRLIGTADLVGDSGQNRVQFAHWVTDSPEFRQAFVNRVWKELMGRGIFEPVDDQRVSNPPVDRQLLTALADQFKQDNFQLKPLVKRIVLSDIYTRVAITKGPQEFLAGYYAKPMRPEVLSDVCRTLLLNEEGQHATETLDPARNDAFLAVIKGCDEGGCTSGSTPVELGLREKLHLINGGFLNRWLTDPNNSFHAALLAGETVDEILGDFYRRALARAWTTAERDFWTEQSQRIANTPEARAQFLQDALWSLLNSRQFLDIQ